MISLKSKSITSKLYWKFLGNFLIIPFAGLTTGSTKIFRYLIKSVGTFLSPNEFTNLLKKAGFDEIFTSGATKDEIISTIEKLIK